MTFKFPPRLLAPFLRSMPAGRLRRDVARSLAARADARALKAEPNDAIVLARLGLYSRASKKAATGAERLLAQAGLGNVAAALDGLNSGRIDPEIRFRAARLLATREPRAALPLVGDADPCLRAATALAAGCHAIAHEAIAELDQREAHAIRAALFYREGQWRAARTAVNRLFAADRLSAPLDEVDEPLGLDSFGGDAAPQNGPLVSVIVPVRDADVTLATSLRSLLAQSWRNLEIVVVDDGGSVETAIPSDARVRLIRNDREPGVAGARNCGAAAATGRYLVFHDADDWTHPERVARQMKALGRRAAVVSQHIRIDASGILFSPRVAPLLRYSPACMLIRTAAFHQVGGFAIMRSGSDSEFLARLDLRRGRRAVVRDSSLLTIASWSGHSLSSSAVDGLNAPAGQAEREAEREQWLCRHAGIANFARYARQQRDREKAA
jgi:hypothetical protein